MPRPNCVSVRLRPNEAKLVEAAILKVWKVKLEQEGLRPGFTVPSMGQILRVAGLEWAKKILGDEAPAIEESEPSSESHE
jgi:hypothetical protein